MALCGIGFERMNFKENTICGVFHRLLATTCMISGLIVFPVFSQDNTANSGLDNSVTRSAVELVLSGDDPEEGVIVNAADSPNDSLTTTPTTAIEAEIEPTEPVASPEDQDVVIENLDDTTQTEDPLVIDLANDNDPEGAEGVQTAIDETNGTTPNASSNSGNDVDRLIGDAVGIDSMSYDKLLGADSGFEPILQIVETKPTPNAMIKSSADTPIIYNTMQNLLDDQDFGLSEAEVDAIKTSYLSRLGELVFVTNEDRYAAYKDTKAHVGDNGLPDARYQFGTYQGKDGLEEFAVEEIRAAAFTMRYGRDMERGLVDPNSLGVQFDITPVGRDLSVLLDDMVASATPATFFIDMEPDDPSYSVLKTELSNMRSTLDVDKMKDVPLVPNENTLKQGMHGEPVGLLRQRLAALGFEAEVPVDESVLTAIVNDIENTATTQATDVMPEAAAPTFDANLFDDGLAKAVMAFQSSMGLSADAIVGPSTINTINNGPTSEMGPLLITMERLRWEPPFKGGRELIVNLATFMAEVRDEQKKTFETVVVIGQNDPKYKTPEFHDELEYLVINPNWNVPYSIAVDEFLPRLQRGGGLGKSYKLLTGGGKAVNPANVNFSKYSAKNFPYRIQQQPGPGNALGNVKFIFPNKHNIYLHDTPSKSLFSQATRTFSHGCVRVRDPRDLAATLMAPYYSDPAGAFNDILATKKERYVEMKTKVPVILRYFTTYVDDGGQIRHTRDVYNRDGLVKKGLEEQGLVF